MADESVQPDTENTDVKPDSQNETQTDNDTRDDFEPKKTAKEYAEKWREASAEAAKYRKELAKLKQDKEKEQQKQLKEQGKYKEMYESTLQEHSKLKEFLVSSARSVAFRQKAIEAGCAPDVVEILEKAASLSEIEVNENYRPDMDQISFEVEKLKEKYGQRFFQKEARAPKDGPPKKPEKGLNYEQWLALPLAEKKKRMSEVKDA